MSVTGEYSTAKLLLRSLTPSGISILLCISGGLAVVALHFLMLSINQGAFLPQLFDGEWAAFYTNTILQPVLAFINNGAVSLAFVALSWAVFGLIVYGVGAGIIKLVRGVRDSQHETQMIGEFSYRSHPLEKSVIGQIIWRLVIGLIMAGLVIAFHPLIQHFLAVDEAFFSGESPMGSGIRGVLMGIVFWALLLQLYVLLLRLYLLRTRVFGEILY